MGNYFASSMQKNQETMMEKQQKLQNQMRERQMATMIAVSRDNFLWFSVFYATFGTGLLAAFKRTKKAVFLTPLVPLTIITAFLGDAAYGSKMHRVRLEAEHILNEETDILGLPCGLPSLSSIKLDVKEENKKESSSSQ